MFRTFAILIFILFSNSIFAQPTGTQNGSHSLIFQVVQDEFVLDNTTIESASIIETRDRVYKGLNIELKSEYMPHFTEITKAGLGRRLNLVFNNVIVISAVIQSPLNGNLLISSISKQDAQAFLNVLNANKIKKK